MVQTCDVMIVGAGPGGATAAYFLSQAGWRVLVLEKEPLPRYKTCGGALSAEMLASIFPFSFRDVTEARPQAMAYALGERLVTIPDPQHRLRTVMRADFDAFLLAQGTAEVRAPASVRRVREDAAGVTVECADGAIYRAPFLIGADGASSVVARDLGLRRGKALAAALEAEVSVSPAVLQRYSDALLFIFGEIRDGYLWIFPKGNHLSVGIAALRPRPGQLQAALARVMARYGIPLEGVPIHGHPIPLTLRREPVSTRRVLLVGDAAGLADPISGEGIRLAITSGKLAAECLLSGHPGRYAELIWERIGRDHALSLRLAGLFYRALPLCYAIGVPNPISTYAFLDLISGRSDYPHLLLRLFATPPLFWLTELAAAVAGRLGGDAHRERLRRAVYTRL